MFRLRLLGGFSLESGEGHRVGPLPQRRAEAVLAYLSVAADRGCRRERLIALLWPDSVDEHGRHSLRNALHAIRLVLGAGAIEATGANLRLSASIDTDVQAFARALSAGRLADAVDLHHGPLLDGFRIDHSTEFERWVENERGRLLQECAHAIEQLAVAAEQERNWRVAAHWWMRAEGLDPFSTPVVVCRMRALAQAGDRAKAVLVGEAHRQRLVKELEVEPDDGLLEELASLRVGEPERLAAPTRRSRPGATAVEPSLDSVFQALQDPTNRAVVEQLSQRAASLCTLERQLAIPAPEVRDYIRSLEASGLVSPRQEGAVRRYRINLSWLRTAERWIAEAARKRLTDAPDDVGRR